MNRSKSKYHSTNFGTFLFHRRFSWLFGWVHGLPNWKASFTGCYNFDAMKNMEGKSFVIKMFCAWLPFGIRLEDIRALMSMLSSLHTYPSHCFHPWSIHRFWNFILFIVMYPSINFLSFKICVNLSYMKCSGLERISIHLLYITDNTRLLYWPYITYWHTSHLCLKLKRKWYLHLYV
jgi:hypothetical protein